jgi:hypothetical protein
MNDGKPSVRHMTKQVLWNPKILPPRFILSSKLVVGLGINSNLSRVILGTVERP